MVDSFGSGGWDFDAEGNLIPRGTTLNSTPDLEFATPQGGQLVTTPNSSTGEPQIKAPSASTWEPSFKPGTALTPSSTSGAPGLPVQNAPQNFGSGQDYVTNLIKNYGIGYVRQYLPEIAARANLPLALLTSMVTPTDQLAPKSRDEAPRWAWPLVPGAQIDPFSNPTPLTQTEPRGRMVPPITGGGGGTPIGPGPEGRGPGMPMGPLAAGPPNNAPLPGPTPPYPPPKPKGASAGGGGQRGGGGRSAGRAAPPITDLQPTEPGYYRASIGNARGSTFVPGVYGNPAVPAPQIYRGPTTAYGLPLQGQGPVGAQNYYTAGSAPVGPGDWTGTAVAAAPVQSGNARGGGGRSTPRAPVRGPLSRGAFQNQGQGQQAPGPMDPTIVAGGPGAPLRASVMDPSILAHMRRLFGGQNPGDYGGYGAPA